MKKETKKGQPAPKLGSILKMLDDVHTALMIERARTGRPMWQIADGMLRKELGLEPRVPE